MGCFAQVVSETLKTCPSTGRPWQFSLGDAACGSDAVYAVPSAVFLTTSHSQSRGVWNVSERLWKTSDADPAELRRTSRSSVYRIVDRTRESGAGGDDKRDEALPAGACDARRAARQCDTLSA